MATETPHEPKYRQVYDALLRQITSGRVGPSGRLPSEAELVQQFGASRITVARALRELQLAGLVDRRAGSGTYVRQSRPAARPLSLGALMPDFGEVEIFSAICRGMLEAPDAQSHAIVWPGTGAAGAGREADAWAGCQQLIARRVDGVFFAPLERTPNRLSVNRRIADAFAAARIPVVLIDRPIEPFPHRGGHDVIGLDNRRAGAIVVSHLLELGCSRIAFVGEADAASTVDARQAGYREALERRGVTAGDELVLRGDPTDSSLVATLMARQSPDAVVAATDRTAGLFMRTVMDLGYRVPSDVRIVGIDDAEYAGLLPVPLTTLRQPCREIGIAAMAALVERIAAPHLPARDILLHGKVVVRASSGT
jgi:GntR family transcriptional regulator, arabinose operon transcriptional repressor